jgi:prepilin peptidase CpaA
MEADEVCLASAAAGRKEHAPMWTTLSNHPVLSLQWGAVIGASLVAAAIDLRMRRIPNWLTGSLFLAGIIWAGWSSGLRGMGDSLSAAVLLALPYMILFTIAGGGAADAKMMGAVGAWLGMVNGCAALVAVCIAGAVLGIAYAVFKRQAQAVWINMILICSSLFSFAAGRRKWSQATQLIPDHQQMLKIPYGVAVFAGVLLAAGTLPLRKSWIGI